MLKYQAAFGSEEAVSFECGSRFGRLLPLFMVSAEQGVASGEGFANRGRMLLDMIPDSFISPFPDKSPMRIILAAVLLGLATLIFSKKTSVVSSFVEQSDYIVQLVMEETFEQCRLRFASMNGFAALDIRPRRCYAQTRRAGRCRLVLFFSVLPHCFQFTQNLGVTHNGLLSAFLIVVILAVVAPPIPGGALTCYTILFAHLGIPAEAMAMTIALNTVLDFFTTASDLYCLQSQLVLLSDSLGMLDVEVLRRGVR